MIEKIKIAFLLLPLFLWGCEQDYPFDDETGYKPKVVVNSLISPDKPITVELFWSLHYSEVKDSWEEIPYPLVDAFAMTLYEDGNVIVDNAAFTAGRAQTQIIPTEGRTYRIEIDVPDYGRVAAETLVPQKSSCRMEFVKRKEKYMHFTVDGIVPVAGCLSYWVFMNASYGDENQQSISELYSINPYVDQINGILDSWEMDLKESNVGFEDFIRIPRRNLVPAQPLNISVWLWESHTPQVDWENPPLDENGEPVWPEPVPLNRVTLELITPSPDFDQYFRTLYRQREYGRYDSAAPFVFETVHVYTNIKNGLGIFAGYNQNSVSYEVPID